MKFPNMCEMIFDLKTMRLRLRDSFDKDIRCDSITAKEIISKPFYSRAKKLLGFMIRNNIIAYKRADRDLFSSKAAEFYTNYFDSLYKELKAADPDYCDYNYISREGSQEQLINAKRYSYVFVYVYYPNINSVKEKLNRMRHFIIKINDHWYYYRTVKWEGYNYQFMDRKKG